MRHPEAMREAPPEEKSREKIERLPAAELIESSEKSPMAAEEVVKPAIGLLEKPAFLNELPPFKEEYNDEESYWDSSESQAEPTGFLQRFAKTRLAKTLGIATGIAALVGVGVESVDAFQESGERLETRTEVSANVQRIALESRLDHAMQKLGEKVFLPSANEELTLVDGRSMLRGERLQELNVEYTENAKSAGIFHFLKDGCSPDGKILTMAECNAKYGDQLPLSPDGLATLVEATGYSPEELALHGEIIRQSVVTRSVSFGGVTAMAPYHAGEIASSFSHERSGVYQDHYAQASELIFTAVRSLDLPQADISEQQETVTSLAYAIRSEIDLTNAITRIANDIQEIHKPATREALFEGLETSSGEKLPDMTRLALAEFQAKTSWNKLATLGPKNGFLAKISETMQHERELQRHELFSQGQRLNVLPEFFAEQCSLPLTDLPPTMPAS